MQTEGNSFTLSGAVWGAGFYNYNSAYRGKFNTFSKMIAVKGGAVMRSHGI